MTTSIANLRKEYSLTGLRRRDLAAEPIGQFQIWFEEALQAQVNEPNAMALATVNTSGQPAVRFVLLKGVDERGFLFFTNYESRKGRELSANPWAALVFYWRELERQVSATGTVSKLPREESEAYFKTRPRGSRLGAWASRQSQIIESREVLEKKLQQLERQYPAEDIPLPESWGGYALAPVAVEFWQGRANRLHDRLCYLRQADGTWRIERLSP